MKRLLVVLLVATSLAGCADDEGTPLTDPLEEGFELEAGKGAISGLLVDDRFRPIQLTDDAQSEFQAEGFILLQETGDQVQTSENGEFAFVDIDPGRYTLRVTASGHETVPMKVDVEEGLFAEASLVARRIESAGSVILTQAQSLFISCAQDVVVAGGNLVPCDGDLSSDGYSSDFDSDFTGLGDSVHAMVTEVKTNQVNRFETQVRHTIGPEAACDEVPDNERYRYAVALFEADYHKITMVRGEINTEDQDNPGYCPNVAWDNTLDFQTIFFVDHQGREEIQSLPWPDGVPFVPPCCGVGFTLAVKANFLQSVFIGVPETDLEAYCALC